MLKKSKSSCIYNSKSSVITIRAPVGANKDQNRLWSTISLLSFSGPKLACVPMECPANPLNPNVGRMMIMMMPMMMMIHIW